MPLTARAETQSILVVDDEPSVRRTVSATLSQAGYVVTAARDVVSATAVLEGGVEFQAILTDLHLPRGRPGVALVEEVERLGLRTPVILMSDALGELDSLDPRIDRVAGLLAKPIRFPTLRSLVRAVAGVCA